MAKGKKVEPKSRCCKSAPRCKRCPVVLKRLRRAGLAKRRKDGAYRLSPDLRKKELTAARQR